MPSHRVCRYTTSSDGRGPLSRISRPKASNDNCNPLVCAYTHRIVPLRFRVYIARDPDNYVDPDKFLPERYLDMDTRTLEKTDPREIIFGFGRRYVC
ncbi:hypothetical protein FOMPIDRAFT_48923 [Fomitopsis schrenkii]|uniref:Cytochrome P450 n=1 Tax=Fomitopsis schrenkii TaxID=2126942 RepID=S8DMS5_FOMSC|nr:hypothetical protein FOMPIDRAFT_48923 [Fomitopsis schrenkii]